MKAGIDPNKLDIDGRTPLHLAMKWNNKNIVQCLLDSNVIDVNSSSDDGKKFN